MRGENDGRDQCGLVMDEVIIERGLLSLLRM